MQNLSMAIETNDHSALVVGNGISRNGLDLSSIKSRYSCPIFGCNALYRTLPDVDFIIAFDQKIVSEIKSSTFSLNKLIVPPLLERFEKDDMSNPCSNAGMIAMREAIKRGYTDLKCIGMDFAVDSDHVNIANMYDGTNAYGPETRATYNETIARCEYMIWFAQQFPNVHFTFYFPEEVFNLPHRLKAPNISYELISTL